MLRINLKEAAKKDDLKRKVEGALAKRTTKGKDNGKGKRKNKSKNIDKR